MAVEGHEGPLKSARGVQVPTLERDPTRQRAVLDAFFTSSRAGDFDALVAVRMKEHFTDKQLVAITALLTLVIVDRFYAAFGSRPPASAKGSCASCRTGRRPPLPRSQPRAGHPQPATSCTSERRGAVVPRRIGAFPCSGDKLRFGGWP